MTDINQFNPAEPNTRREINLIFTTDENGEMEIDIDSVGFEADPQFVPLFIHATLEALKSGTPISR
jgi:hypothetical protein